jgi:hypothetical protein
MAEKLIYASAARTATPAPVTVNAGRYRELTLVIDVTAVTAAPSTVVNIERVDSASGKFLPVLSSAALVAAGTVTLTVAIGAAVTANASANASLPQTFRINSVHSNANSMTYSVSAHLR